MDWKEYAWYSWGGYTKIIVILMKTPRLLLTSEEQFYLWKITISEQSVQRDGATVGRHGLPRVYEYLAGTDSVAMVNKQ